jgi:NhaP-type Na+/H+ and K+/H+ antiporter
MYLVTCTLTVIPLSSKIHNSAEPAQSNCISLRSAIILPFIYSSFCVGVVIGLPMGKIVISLVKLENQMSEHLVSTGDP